MNSSEFCDNFKADDDVDDSDFMCDACKESKNREREREREKP